MESLGSSSDYNALLICHIPYLVCGISIYTFSQSRYTKLEMRKFLLKAGTLIQYIIIIKEWVQQAAIKVTISLGDQKNRKDRKSRKSRSEEKSGGF